MNIKNKKYIFAMLLFAGLVTAMQMREEDGRGMYVKYPGLFGDPVREYFFSTETVYNVRENIAQQTGVDITQVLLMHKCNELPDNRVLHTLLSEEGEDVVLLDVDIKSKS